MKTPRETLTKLQERVYTVGIAHQISPHIMKKDIDSALSDLKDWVLGQKKKCKCSPYKSYCDCGCLEWNGSLDHIAERIVANNPLKTEGK